MLVLTDCLCRITLEPVHDNKANEASLSPCIFRGLHLAADIKLVACAGKDCVSKATCT